MKSWALIAAGAALAGCFDKPPFRGGGDDDIDAGPTDPACTGAGPITTGLDGMGRSVICGPGYSMRFSIGGYGFPDSFRVGGTELLRDRDTCEDEDRFGIGFYPAGIIAGSAPRVGQQVEGGRRVAVEVATPFLVKVGIEWRASFGTCTLAPHGRTTFTFMPDGRVWRADHILDVTGASAASCPGGCPEASSSAWRVTSFAAFAVTDGQSITPEPPPTLGDHGPGNDLQMHTSCIAGDDYAIAVGLNEELPRRLRSPSDQTIAYVQELLPAPAATLPTTLDGWLHSFFLVRTPRTECTPLRTELEAHTAQNPQLLLNGVSLDVSHDGLWGGENDEGNVGYPIVDTATLQRGGPVDLTAGWGVWLRFSQIYTRVDVTKTGGPATGDWYLAGTGLGDGTQAIFWFRDPLATGETITIHGHD